MAPRTGERMPIPAPMKEREALGRGAGPVTTYFLSPEELERYRAQPKSPYKRPTDYRFNKKSEGAEDDMARKLKDGPACGLTKKAFLEAIAKGETMSSIEKAWGMKYNTIHDWVKRWELKGITADKARELLAAENECRHGKSGACAMCIVDGDDFEVAAAEEAPISHVDPEHERLREKLQAEKSETEHLKAELEQVKAANVEAVLMAGEAAEKFQAEIDRLTDDNAELLKEVIEKEVEIGSLVNQVNALKGNNYVPGFLNIRIPIIADTGDRFLMVKKVHEELEEVGVEIEGANIDRRKAAGELYDLVQAFTGLIRAELSDLVVTGSVDELLQQFFEHHNAQHVEKIQRYAAERGWRLVSAG